MTPEELNTRLYQKMAAEQEQYKAYLLTFPPVQILDYAREYINREDILITMQSNKLDSSRAKVLLKSPTPLADVYKKWKGWELNGQQKEMWNAVQARSGEVLRAEFAAAQRAER